MNDGLREAIERGYRRWEDAEYHDPVDAIEAAVRDWLALPPSEEEIEAAAKAEYRYFFNGEGKDIPWELLGEGVKSRLLRGSELALIAARAVPPPEDAR